MKKMAWALLMLSALWVAVPVSAQDSYGGSDGLVIESDDGGAVPGSTIRIVQTGFDPDTEVLIRIVDNNGNVIDGVEVLGAIAVRADAQGTVDVELRLPEGTAAGVYDILLSGTVGGEAVESIGQIQVLAAANTTVTPDAGTTANTTSQADAALALTGSESRIRAIGGVLLVALGLGLVVVAAGRRSETSELPAS